MKKLSETARQARNAYTRAWRARNKEKVRETNRQYWERRATRVLDGETARNGDTPK